MAKAVWNGGALLAPVPAVMVTVRDGDRDNIITVAWTGILSTVPPKTYISVRPSRHSYEMLKNSGEFAINLTPSSLVKTADYCGMYTGKKVDKFEKCSLTKENASKINCPLIAECPISLECKITDIVPMGSHDMFIADVVAVDVEEGLIGENGRLHISRAKLSAFAHGEYFEIGRRIGKFGFSAKSGNHRGGKKKGSNSSRSK